jgi:RND family efflux transporter MFP subunit
VEDLLVNARQCFLSTICCVTASLALADGPENKPPIIHACVPVERQVSPYEDLVGRIDAAATVELKPRVTGYLERVLFKDGAEVKKGDVLFEIDPRPYRAQLAKAEADLGASEARFQLVKSAFDRAAAMQKNGVLSTEEVAKAASERDVAAANVQVARAALDAARITLGFTRVTAPIDGRIGRRLLDVGNLVKADETPLARIINTDSMAVHFDIDERTFLRINPAAKDGKRKELGVTIGLADEADFPRRAKVDFVDSRVDPATGTIRARAILLDSDNKLLPGMSCRIRLATGEPQQALLVPELALESMPPRILCIVNDQNRIETRSVELGQGQTGEMRVVTKGLKAGERVALDVSRASTENSPIVSVRMVDSAWRPAPEPTTKKQ